MKIYHVLSNLKFGADFHAKGDVIEVEEEVYGYLVKEGILKELVGAKTIDEGKEIVKQEEIVESEKGSAEIEKPQDTWKAKPDPEEKEADLSGQETKIIPKDEKPVTPVAPKENVTGKELAPNALPPSGNAADLEKGDNL